MSGDSNQTCPTEGDDATSEFVEVNTRKERKLRSNVWKNFKKFKMPTGELVAVCNHCKNTLASGSVSGTTHLRNHLKRKHPEVIVESGEKRGGSTPKLQPYKFDQEKSRLDLATMIIKHNYPLNIVEHEWFEIYSHGLNPEFNIVSRNTIRTDIISIYKAEKVKVYEFLESLPCKITLTTDIWTSEHQNFAYACLTAHYIDDNWELKKKILAYRYIEYPHDGETLFKFTSDLILEWNIDKKLFAMVVDNATSNDVMVRLLKSRLQDKSLLPLSGKLFHVRCSAHILNLIVQDGLKEIKGLLAKIRGTVRYLRNSTFAKQKFDNAVQQVKLRGKKKIPVDAPHRWNSTYSMLEVAIHMREALDRLSELDRNYKLNPSVEEWKVANVLKDCLSVFYESTTHFSGTKFPTSNVFFPDICKLRLQFSYWENSGHQCLRMIAPPMKLKFEKYWDECSLALAVAVIFDPRFKFRIVEYYYDKIYGSERAMPYTERVREAFVGLYNEYSSGSFGGTCDMVDSNSCSSSSKVDQFTDFDNWCDQDSTTFGSSKKSEWEKYMGEPLFPRTNEFCILNWWKINSATYPILAKISRDILAVPATTVASESAFSIGGRVVDETRASLLPELVEALVTTSDWIESQRKRNVEEPSEGEGNFPNATTCNF